MLFTQKLLLTIPNSLLGIIIVGGGVALSVVGLFIMRRLVPHHKLKLHNDVTGPIFGTLGTVYAVLVAFVAVVVWENFDRTNMNVEKEVNCLVDIYRDAGSFSPEFKQQARALVREYAQGVVDQEWKALAWGGVSQQVDKTLKRFWEVYGNYTIRSETEKAFFGESVHKLNELSELRITRVLDSRNGMRPLLWFVLILGGITMIMFTFFFGAENFTAQLTMVVLLTTLITLILFTILSFDFPFTGSVVISAEPFKQLIAATR